MWLHGGRRQREASTDRQSFVTITTKATRVVKFNIHCHNHCEKMMKKVLLLLVEGICLCAAHHTHTYVRLFVRSFDIYISICYTQHTHTNMHQTD